MLEGQLNLMTPTMSIYITGNSGTNVWITILDLGVDNRERSLCLTTKKIKSIMCGGHCVVQSLSLCLKAYGPRMFDSAQAVEMMSTMGTIN